MLDLRLIGLDEIKGYWTPDVISQWDESFSKIEQITAVTAKELLDRGEITILDVRGSAEYKEGHVPETVHIPLGYLEGRLDEVSSDKPLVVHCLSGFRSSIAASILDAHGHAPIANLVGGYQAWSAAGGSIERSFRETEAVASWAKLLVPIAAQRPHPEVSDAEAQHVFDGNAARR